MSTMRTKGLMLLVLSTFFASNAWAVYSQQVIIDTGDVSATDGATLSFTTVTGDVQPVEVEKSEDGQIVAIIRFQGERSAGMSEAGTLTLNRPGESASSWQVPSALADQTIELGDGGAVRVLRLPKNDTVPDPLLGWSVGLGYQIGDYTLGQTGTSGITSEITGELFVLAGIDEVELDSAEISIGFRFGDNAENLIHGSYSSGSGDDQTRTDVATQTATTGLVFTDFAGGFTGIGLTPFGVASEQSVDIDRTNFSVGYSRRLQPSGWIKNYLTLRNQLNVGTLEVHHWSLDQLIDPVLVGQEPSVERDQSVDQTTYELEIGLGYTHSFNDRLSLSAEIAPVFRYIDADLDSHELIRCAFCPMLENTEVRRRDRETGFSVGAAVDVGLTYQFTDNFALSGALTWRDGADNAFWDSVQTGDDLAVRNDPASAATENEGYLSGQLRAFINF